ncbi:YiaA/YiaB family inner membrane protein [Phytohabitans aurantiacus]|uniref:YiaAB two helix domain-containing protein n=1 Tax=Phytohabitans aurantiacus TaxID=3016789 RepID=A0ABQ5R637_9ACTN|nr:YiaA/YiaB family inner membrane protein [Phytohabitans aurantiacus]GLI01668.1 hypothetical protein Pa4123_69440 [Phytohabitans aurantiacus]
MYDRSNPTQDTTAFFVQAGLSFAASMVAVGVGIAYLPIGPWIRAFLAIGVLYVVTSAFTLANLTPTRRARAAPVCGGSAALAGVGAKTPNLRPPVARDAATSAFLLPRADGARPGRAAAGS